MTDGLFGLHISHYRLIVAAVVGFFIVKNLMKLVINSILGTFIAFFCELFSCARGSWKT